MLVFCCTHFREDESLPPDQGLMLMTPLICLVFPADQVFDKLPSWSGVSVELFRLVYTLSQILKYFRLLDFFNNFLVFIFYYIFF